MKPFTLHKGTSDLVRRMKIRGLNTDWLTLPNILTQTPVNANNGGIPTTLGSHGGGREGSGLFATRTVTALASSEPLGQFLRSPIGSAILIVHSSLSVLLGEGYLAAVSQGPAAVTAHFMLALQHICRLINTTDGINSILNSPVTLRRYNHGSTAWQPT